MSFFFRIFAIKYHFNMAKSKLRNSTELLFDNIFDAMHEKKAEDILLLDLTKIKGANFDYFIITHGNSTTQVNAIAEEIRRKVKTVLRMNPAHAKALPIRNGFC